MNMQSNFLTNDATKNSFILLSCDGDNDREYRDSLIVDMKYPQIGIHVVHFDGESSPNVLMLLVDGFIPDPLYENDSKINNLLGSSNPNTAGKETDSKKPEVKIVDGSKDPELNLAKGVKKIEKSQKAVKEGNVEYMITKTVTYMDDGEIKTDISKEKL